MEQGKTIGNVNILDLRNATEASVDAIKRIGNVNLLIYPQEKAALVTRLKAGNLNLSVEVPTGTEVQQLMGQTTLVREYFQKLKAPLCLLVMGQVVVDPDVQAEDFEKNLVKMIVMGQIYCPEPLAGAIQSRTRVMGQTIVYPLYKKTKIGSLTLDQGFLSALDDSTDIAIAGDLRVPLVLPNDQLQRKLGKLFVSGNITVHEENAQVIRTKLVKNQSDFLTIPAGFTLVGKPLNLDASMIEFLPDRKLFCTERVNIAADVDAATLDKYVDALKSEDLILCPAALKSVLARKCDLFETRAVFYEGELMLVDDSRHLTTSRLNRVTGKVTLVVTGELVIEPDVTPAMLADKVTKVHNLGSIVCTPEQMGVIESRLGLHEGQLRDSTLAEHDEKETDENTIGNMNILEL